MTRKLPWKRSEIGLTGTPPSVKSTPARQQKIKRDNSDADDKESITSLVSAKKIKISLSGSAAPNKKPRAGSTSPPPEPLPESYMIEGLENDDLYRMVEDEFFATAQQYTAHLHAAEYHRLKAASKSQNADTIRDISRPVVGRMTDLVKKKQERKTRLEKQKEAYRKAQAAKGQDGNKTDSQDDDWNSASLYGLMESPRKKVARLDNLTKVATTTRAAAGFNTTIPNALLGIRRPAPSNNKQISKPVPHDDSETEDDTDDGMAPPSPTVKAAINWKARPSATQPPNPRPSHSVTKPTQPSRPVIPMRPNSQQATKPSKANAKGNSSDSSDGDPFSRLKRRHEERTRAREHQRTQASSSSNKAKAKASHTTTNDIIPGFL
ncbi:hypothetical protein M426DRAFT_223971 [Hypoxylon sp. CI-4A]|nr:hypothetical protein M426DRAFT_223971 [Hypoxylon sp. CI-4A]